MIITVFLYLLNIRKSFLLGLIDILALSIYICFNYLNPIFDLIIIICHETRLKKRL